MLDLFSASFQHILSFPDGTISIFTMTCNNNIFSGNIESFYDADIVHISDQNIQLNICST